MHLEEASKKSKAARLQTEIGPCPETFPSSGKPTDLSINLHETEKQSKAPPTPQHRGCRGVGLSNYRRGCSSKSTRLCNAPQQGRLHSRNKASTFFPPENTVRAKRPPKDTQKDSNDIYV